MIGISISTLNYANEAFVDATKSTSSNKKGCIRVLHVDDDLGLLEVSKQVLSMENNFEIDNVTSVDEAFKKLEKQTYDIVVSDYEMPQKNGLDFLEALRESKCEIPFVLFTGRGREEVVVKALNLGADSYINKNGAPELVYCELADAINKTVERKTSKKLLAESEMKYRSLVDNSLQGILVTVGSPLKLVFANEAMSKILGYSIRDLMLLSPEEIMGLIYVGDRTTFFNRMKNRLLGNPAESCYEFRAVKKDHSIIWLRAIANRIEFNGQLAVQGMFLDITEVKQSEEEVRNLAKFPSENPNPVLRISKDGAVLYANASAQSKLGDLKIQKGERAPEILRKNAIEVLGSDLEKSIEFQYENKQFVFSMTPITKENYVNVYGFDITERKKAENLLRESEEKYRLLIDFAHEGIFALDPRYSIVFVNPRMAEILGFQESEISGKSVFCFIPERGFGHLMHYLEYCKQGISGEFELELICKGGFPINVLFSTSSIKDDAGNFDGILVLVSDITARKKIEESLRQERETLEKVTENIGAGLTLISKDYHILWANNYLNKLNGSLENKICYSTFNTLNKICPDCGVNKVFNGASSDTREYLNQDLSKKGLPCWFEIIATPVKDDNGEIIAALELTVDITEKKRMQEKLIDYSQNLEKKVKEKTQQLSEAQAIIVKSERLAAIGELAGMIGHDLRNPLSGIKNAAYFLNKNDASCSKEKNKEMLKIIDDAVNHSDKIINDLLDYARNLHLELQDLSAKKLLDESLQMVQIPVRIEIYNNLREGLRFQVDLDKIKRVFINLIKNAIDAMPNGGILEISGKIQNDYIEISFADQGIGISEENKSKIFSPLFTTKAQGMGFGLSICKRIVEAHDGKIFVRSTLGKGTTFEVRLPAQRLILKTCQVI